MPPPMDRLMTLAPWSTAYRIAFGTSSDPSASELSGLVYGCTELPSESHLPLYRRPIFWAAVVAVVFVILQVIFW